MPIQLHVHAPRPLNHCVPPDGIIERRHDNIRAVDVSLGADELARLDALTKPTFGFPHNMLEMAPGIINGGTTVNGFSAPTSEYVMPEGIRPY